MKIKNEIIFISLMLLVLLSITCVSATQEIDENSTLEASDAINEVSTSFGQTIQISESNSDNAQLSAVNYDVEDSSSSGGAISTDVLNFNSNVEDECTAVNAAETYDLKVTDNGDSGNNLGASDDKIDVYFVAPDRTLHVEEIDNGYSYPIILRDIEGNGLANKPVTLTFNGQTQTLKTNSRGWAYFNVSADDAGYYPVSLDFAGDSDYNSLSCLDFRAVTVIKWNVSFVAPNKKFDVEEIVDGYSYGLTLRDSEGTALAGKKVSATFNGKTQTKTTNANGRAYFNLSAGAGVYQLGIDFAGDTYYNALSEVRTITVIGRNVTFVAPNKKFNVDEVYDGYTYGMTLRDSNGTALAGKKITFTFNGKTQTKTTNANGRAYFNLSAGAGVYQLGIDFAGDDYYFPLSEVRTITVIGCDVSFVAPNKKLYVDEIDKYYTYGLTLRDNDGNALAGKKVTVNFNGKTQTKTTNANGRVYFNLTAGKYGSYPVNIDFAGDDYYNSLSEVKNITVVKYNVTLNTEQNTFDLDDISAGVTYPVILRDSDGNPLDNKNITVTFNGKTYVGITDSNGYCYFNLTAEKSGYYQATIKFAGTKYYYSKKLSKTIKVIPIDVTFTAEDKTIYVDEISSGYNYTVVLKEVEGNAMVDKRVTITFNGKKQSGRTDSDGVVIFTLTVDKAGSYPVSLDFAGDSNHNTLSVTNFKTVKVLAYDTKLAWKSETTFSSGSQTLKVLLTDSKNAALSGKTVKLTINSNTYSAKTDSNGYVTFSLNLGSNTYTASYKFEGDNMYNPSSGSTQITVKSYSVSINDILTASETVKNYYANNKKLPTTVTMAGNSYTMPEFLYLMSQAIYQLGSYNTNPITAIIGAKDPSSPSGDDINAQLNKADYLTMAKSVADYIKSNNQAPNYASSAVGKIHYTELVEASARILAFYKNNDKYLPNYVTISYGSSPYSGPVNVINTITDLTPYYKSTSNCQVNNSQIKALVDSLTKGITSDEQKAIVLYNYVRDHISYSFYYDTKYGAVGTLNAKTGNCVDQAHLLVAMYRTAGLAARYEHGTCYFPLSGSTYGHVWTQVLIGNIWVVGDPVSERNSFGVVNNWNVYSYTHHGYYASLPF